MTDETTTRQAVVCALSEEDPLSPSELVDRVDRTPRSIRYALRDLEEEGIVRWYTDPTDTRYRRYQLTEGRKDAWSRLCQGDAGRGGGQG